MKDDVCDIFAFSVFKWAGGQPIPNISVFPLHITLFLMTGQLYLTQSISSLGKIVNTVIKARTLAVFTVQEMLLLLMYFCDWKCIW